MSAVRAPGLLVRPAHRFPCPAPAQLDAATHEFNYRVQRMLLKAASFGKLFCADYRADNFVVRERLA